jgi:hypothetical protein
MNTTIKALMAKLERTERDAYQAIKPIKQALQNEWDKVFSVDKALKRDLDALERSNDYGSDEGGEIYRWVHADLERYAECKDCLDTYLEQEYFTRIDWKNGALMTDEGPSLVIDDDGDVYDQYSRKTIIKAGEYKDDDELRNELIEQWMEKNGYFPGVFRWDRHGNIFHVDTRRAKDKTGGVK